MYEETADSTHSRALCVPSPRKNESEKEILRASDVKCLIEEALEQRQNAATPKEIPTKGFPLSEELQRQPVQPGFKLPQLAVYLGKEDPERHLQHFVAMAVLHGWNEVTRCRAFPLSLAGQAQQWFTELPTGHIRSFEQLKKEFLEAFSAYVPKKKSAMYLLSLQQKTNEPLKQYME